VKELVYDRQGKKVRRFAMSIPAAARNTNSRRASVVLGAYVFNNALLMMQAGRRRAV